MLKKGNIIGGRYRILREIGRGGMNLVFLAIDEKSAKRFNHSFNKKSYEKSNQKSEQKSNRKPDQKSNQKSDKKSDHRYAVKEVRPDGKESMEMRKQYLKEEAELLKMLNHPGIVKMEDLIEEGCELFLIQEYVEGVTLQNILKENGAQPRKIVLEWGIQICEMLVYMHGLSPPLLYLDLKPSNLIRRKDGRLILVDFGSARQMHDSEWELFPERVAHIPGTAFYSSKEQREGGALDARADLYSLGVVLYQLFIGHLPTEDYYNEKNSDDFFLIIKKCMQEKKEERYSSAAELLEDLLCLRKEEEKRIHNYHIKISVLISLIILAILISYFSFFIHQKMEEQRNEEAYEAIIEKAAASSGDKKMEYCRQAINRKPEDAKACFLYLDALLEDQEITAEEDRLMREFLAWIPDKGNSSVQEILAEDLYAYCQFCYEAAVGYYCFYEEDERHGRAVEWMREYLRVSGNLSSETDKKKQQIERILSVDEFSQRVNFPDPEKRTESFLYKELWGEYHLLLENLQSEQGEEDLKIRIFTEAAAQIQDHARDFMKAGVTIEEMRKCLDEMEPDETKSVKSDSAEPGHAEPGPAESDAGKSDFTEWNPEFNSARREERCRILEENREAARVKLESIE